VLPRERVTGWRTSRCAGRGDIRSHRPEGVLDSCDAGGLRTAGRQTSAGVSDPRSVVARGRIEELHGESARPALDPVGHSLRTARHSRRSNRAGTEPRPRPRHERATVLVLDPAAACTGRFESTGAAGAPGVRTGSLPTPTPRVAVPARGASGRLKTPGFRPSDAARFRLGRCSGGRGGRRTSRGPVPRPARACRARRTGGLHQARRPAVTRTATGPVPAG
jgi:hypothetical protein